MTTIESAPPRTTVFSLPPFTRSNERLQLDWEGYDPGNSGVAEYDLQYRIGNGNWINWTTYSHGPIDFENPAPGQTYYFRIRGRDRAQNEESWTGGNGDTFTTVYTWGIQGTVQDNSGVPVQNITLATNPTSFHTLTGDTEGQYAGYVATEAQTYTVDWEKDTYGDLPATDFAASTDPQLNVVLPPADNVLVNSGFESGSFQPDWTAAGTSLPVMTDTLRNTGQYAASLGTVGWETEDVLLGVGSKPLVALGPEHTVHVIWKNDSNNGALQYTRRDIAVGADGTVHFVFSDYNSGGYRQRPANGSWSQVQKLITPAIEWGEQVPQIAIDASGLAHVVWDIADGHGHVSYVRQTSDGSWTWPQVLTNQPAGERYPQMVIDEFNLPHIVWNGVYYNGPNMTDEATDARLTQTFTIPVTMSTPVLSFLYQMGNVVPDSGSGLTVTLNDDTDTTSLLELDENTAEWTHQWVDLSQWAGEVVTITFHLHQAADVPEVWSYVDEVTMGAAHPDVWVAVAPTAPTLPGEQVVFSLTYGNRGGAVASNNLMTFTLPTGITFVSATVPPVTTLPLLFNLGDFAATSVPGSFTITGLVSPTAVPFTTLISTAEITTASVELETVNNTTEASTYIGRFTYMPIMMR